jgi:transcriptional regulator with XRE-family HTH domain
MKTKPEEFYALLGNRVRTFRQQKGLTQEQLGSRLTPTMTRASVANIETGKQRVLTHTLIQLSGALDVSLDDLTRAEPISVSAEVSEQVNVVLRKRLRLSQAQAQRFTESLGLVNSKRERNER